MMWNCINWSGDKKENLGKYILFFIKKILILHNYLKTQLTKVIPHISDLKSNLSPHVTVSKEKVKLLIENVIEINILSLSRDAD